jgi:AraC-like DNA-binding protein
MHKVYYNPDIRILVCKKERLEKWRFANLAAPFWRIYYNVSPGGRIVFEKREIELETDKIYLISPDTDFMAKNSQPFEQLYIHFQAKEPFDICPGMILSFEYQGFFKELIDKICWCLEDEDAANQSLSMNIVLLSHMLLMQVPAEDLQRGWNDSRVIKVISFIENNYAQKISNNDFAEMAGMNTNAFARLFKEQTGMSPQRFLSHKRISEACLLLRYSKLTIDEIAEVTGFCDRHYFTRVFTKMRCMSPAAFRKLPH